MRWPPRRARSSRGAAWYTGGHEPKDTHLFCHASSGGDAGARGERVIHEQHMEDGAAFCSGSGGHFLGVGGAAGAAACRNGTAPAGAGGGAAEEPPEGKEAPGGGAGTRPGPASVVVGWAGMLPFQALRAS